MTIPITGAGTIQDTAAIGGASATGSVMISNTPSPNMTSTATAFSPATNGFGASFTITASEAYSMIILGPSGTVPVQVNASGADTVTSLAPGAFSNNLAMSSFAITRSSYGAYEAPVFQADLNAYGGSYAGPTSQTFTESGIFNLPTNTILTDTLSSYLSTDISGLQGGGTETLSASVDPYFVIEGLNPLQYTILFSQGVGNAPSNPVAEPDAVAVFAVAFAGLGAIRVRPGKTGCCWGTSRNRSIACQIAASRRAA